MTELLTKDFFKYWTSEILLLTTILKLLKDTINWPNISIPLIISTAQQKSHMAPQVLLGAPVLFSRPRARRHHVTTLHSYLHSMRFSWWSLSICKNRPIVTFEDIYKQGNKLKLTNYFDHMHIFKLHFLNGPAPFAFWVEQWDKSRNKALHCSTNKENRTHITTEYIEEGGGHTFSQ